MQSLSVSTGKSLTSDEKQAIYSYSGSSYSATNSGLRGCMDSIHQGKSCGEMDTAARLIQTGLHKLPHFAFHNLGQRLSDEKLQKLQPEPDMYYYFGFDVLKPTPRFLLYRVMGSDVNKFLPAWQPGHLYYDAAFVSTTLHQVVVTGDESTVIKTGMPGYHRVRMMIEPLATGSRGHDIVPVTREDEQEVLFESGTLFCVLARDGDDLNRHDVRMVVAELPYRVDVQDADGARAVLKEAESACQELLQKRNPEAAATKHKKGNKPKAHKPPKVKSSKSKRFGGFFGGKKSSAATVDAP